MCDLCLNWEADASGVFSGQAIRPRIRFSILERILGGLAAVVLHQTNSQGWRPLGEGGSVHGTGVLLQLLWGDLWSFSAMRKDKLTITCHHEVLGKGVLVNLGVYMYAHCFQTLSLFSHLVIMWFYESSPLKQLLWFVETKTELFCLNSKHNICWKMSSAQYPSIPNMK